MPRIDRVRILPYKSGSTSASRLGMELEVMRLRRDVSSRYIPRDGDVIINWGCTSRNIPFSLLTTNVKWINHPTAVKIAANKLSTFKVLQHLNIATVPWTEDHAVAQEWLSNGDVVYSRTRLSGHSGAGIIVNLNHNEVGSLAAAPLYTKRLNAIGEYRVHVVGGRVIDIQRKAPRNGVPSNPYIRSHDNGYVYARQGVAGHEDMRAAAVNAVNALELEFGAVDILWYRAAPYILEINTACGLEGETVNSYANALKEYYD